MSLVTLLKTLVRDPWRVGRVVFQLARNLEPVAQFLEARQEGRWLSIREGSLKDEEYGLLQHLAQEAEGFSGPIIEIGTLLGATTTRIAAWTSPDRRIITVDNYSWTRWGLTSETQFDLAALVLLHPISRGQVRQVRADKNQWCAEYEGKPPSLVFCDAIHTYEETRADIAWARRVGAKLIAGHDYSDEFPGVVQAVDEAGGPERLAGSLWALPAVVE